MTRFCPDCGKQINDASGCKCKTRKQLKEWMPKLLEASWICQVDDANHCAHLSDGQNACSSCPLVIAGAKAVIDEIINRHDGGLYPVKRIIPELRLMLKELEEMK